VLRTSGTKIINSPGTCCKTSPLMAADAGAGSAAPLTTGQLARIVSAAKQRWVGTGLLTADEVSSLEGARFTIEDLGGLELGVTEDEQVTIDVDAAGHGWFLGPARSQISSSNIDLLTVVMHELGHAMGFEHHEEGVMESSLGTGERRLPSAPSAPASDLPAPVAAWSQASYTIWYGWMPPPTDATVMAMAAILRAG
jgi:hypothetical protein